ncbi:MAG: AAA family ATPase [Candidatus Kariarchaeaceae archaeon]
MTKNNLKEFYESVLAEVKKRIVGKDYVVELVLSAILASGHVLLEGVPGIAKTYMASTLSEVLGLEFNRVQFTPDLLPADITGTNVYNQKSSEFEFISGPVFCNLLLCDEINRAPPKTQAALLESMQERQVTSDGVTRKLSEPFIVLATQNPIEQSGVYPLPEAQLDRFMMRVMMAPPQPNDEFQMLKMKREEMIAPVNKISSMKEVLAMREAINSIKISDEVLQYISNIVTSTRKIDALSLGASPRASLALMSLSRARAAIQGRDYVQPDDVKTLVFPVLNHRLILSPEAELSRVSVNNLITQLIKRSEVVI